MDNQYIKEFLQRLADTEIWKGTVELCRDYDEGIRFLTDTFITYKKDAARVFFIGNGGSAAIASHMTADFMKNGGMNTCSLYDGSVLTCMGNDYGYTSVFSRPMEFLVNEKDLVVAVSSSGNSLNIINAIETAKKKKAGVLTFTGFKRDNRVKEMGDINVYVPCEKYGIVESIHNLILQQIVDMIMKQDGAEP